MPRDNALPLINKTCLDSLSHALRLNDALQLETRSKLLPLFVRVNRRLPSHFSFVLDSK